ncbi:MAG TPA: alpha/beta fold hydrolase [Myxococcota bacterium]|nr:alpha/beta fold hydrolase [Myxococcota bacterium]
MKLALGALVLIVAVVAVGVQMGHHEPIDLVAVARSEDGVALAERFVETAPGVRLHVVEAGPPDGPLVLLLHGFPEMWWTWHAHVASLAHAGFRVLAPDLRGFDASDKPGPVEAYRSEALRADVVALIESAGERDALVAAHDFGAIVAWDLALHEPERLRRMVVFNVGHPLAWIPPEERGEEQVNWFRVFFQIPVLPELVGPFGDWWLMAKNLRDSSRPGTFDEPVMSYYKQAWARPGAFGAMIDWYRAAYRYRDEIDPDAKVDVPTRIVFGMKDVFNDPGSGPRSLAHCTRCEFVPFEGAGHWLLNEEPEATARLILEHFTAP